MAGVFADLLPGNVGTRDLSADEVQQVMGLRSKLQSVDNGASRYWYDPSHTDLGGGSLADWQVVLNRGMDYAQGDGGENAFNSAKDKYTIQRPRLEAEEGNLGDTWDETGKYQGTYSTEQHGWKDMMQAIALMGGGYLGGTYLSGLNGAQTGVTGLANGADLSLLYGGEGVGAGAGGLTTSAGTGGLSAAELAAYSPELTQTAYTGATGLTPASTAPGWMSTAKDLYTGAGQFLNSGWGKALTTAAGLAMTKNAKQGPADPMLASGAAGLQGISDAATKRAATTDEMFQKEFLPRYLAMMGRADQRDQELYDFNMGRARLAAGQMDKFYGAVDAYDNEAARERMAGEAGATAEQQSSAAMNQLIRNMQRKGVNPNSGVMISNMRQQAQQGALGKAMAINLTREAARREGMNMRATAAGLRGADSAYAGNALQGAGLGLSSVNSANSGVNANNSNWTSTMSLGANALGQVGGWGLSRSNSADQLSAANTAGWNGLIGYGLGQLWNSGAKTGGG